MSTIYNLDTVYSTSATLALFASQATSCPLCDRYRQRSRKFNHHPILTIDHTPSLTPPYTHFKIPQVHHPKHCPKRLRLPPTITIITTIEHNNHDNHHNAHHNEEQLPRRNV
eukprot:jgi/Psemu1/12747/gm1.12747_g